MDAEYNVAIGVANGIAGFSNYYSGKWISEYYDKTKSLAGSFELGIYATAGSFTVGLIFVCSKFLIDWKANQIDSMSGTN